MKNKFFGLLTVALIAAGASPALASVGPAGCGLGSLVFHKDNQVMAATTNDSSYTNVFGITSGTSNCVDSGGTAMVMFVDANRVALSNEAARGKGETVDALASMMGCSDASVVGPALKSNFGRIFEANGENTIAITKSIKETLAPVCGHVG